MANIPILNEYVGETLDWHEYRPQMYSALTTKANASHYARLLKVRGLKADARKDTRNRWYICVEVPS